MRYQLNDHEWAAIKPMLPNKPRGVPRVNDRRILNVDNQEQGYRPGKLTPPIPDGPPHSPGSVAIAGFSWPCPLGQRLQGHAVISASATSLLKRSCILSGLASMYLMTTATP
jgi:hypothetical protein